MERFNDDQILKWFTENKIKGFFSSEELIELGEKVTPDIIYDEEIQTLDVRIFLYMRLKYQLHKLKQIPLDEIPPFPDQHRFFILNNFRELGSHDFPKYFTLTEEFWLYERLVGKEVLAEMNRFEEYDLSAFGRDVFYNPLPELVKIFFKYPFTTISELESYLNYKEHDFSEVIKVLEELNLTAETVFNIYDIRRVINYYPDYLYVLTFASHLNITKYSKIHNFIKNYLYHSVYYKEREYLTKFRLLNHSYFIDIDLYTDRNLIKILNKVNIPGYINLDLQIFNLLKTPTKNSKHMIKHLKKYIKKEKK